MKCLYWRSILLYQNWDFKKTCSLDTVIILLEFLVMLNTHANNYTIIIQCSHHRILTPCFLIRTWGWESIKNAFILPICILHDTHKIKVNKTVNRPFARSSHMVRNNLLCWNASYTVTLKHILCKRLNKLLFGRLGNHQWRTSVLTSVAEFESIVWK